MIGSVIKYNIFFVGTFCVFFFQLINIFQPKRTLRGHTFGVLCLCVLNNGYLASGSGKLETNFFGFVT